MSLIKNKAILNANRPETKTAESAVDYLRLIEGASLLKADAIVNNTHLCGETDVDCVLKGAALAEEVSPAGIPDPESGVYPPAAYAYSGKSVSEQYDSETLKSHEIPTYIEFLDCLPLMEGSEKVNYRALEERAAKEA